MLQNHHFLGYQRAHQIKPRILNSESINFLPQYYVIFVLIFFVITKFEKINFLLVQKTTLTNKTFCCQFWAFEKNKKYWKNTRYGIWSDEHILVCIFLHSFHFFQLQIFVQNLMKLYKMSPQVQMILKEKIDPSQSNIQESDGIDL